MKTVGDKLKEDYYTNKLPRSNLLDSRCSKCNHRYDDGHKYCSQCGLPLEEHQQYIKEARRLYRVENIRLEDKFYEDCMEELGIQDNPKKEILWITAWDLGHSNGRDQVWYYLQRLVVLIK